MPVKNTTRTLVECAIMIALGTILAKITLFEMPQGGSVTAVSMLPFIIIAYRHGVKWGLMTGFVNACLQMLLGKLYAPPAGTALAFFGMIMLDYVLAYMVLGFAGLMAKPFKNCYVAVTVSVIGTCFLRFLCSFLSGVLLYASYAPEGTPAVIYSLGYNASYMVPEAIITVAVALVICAARPEIFGMKRPAVAAAAK